MDLQQIFQLLSIAELEGKLTLRDLPTLYDPNGDVTLTVRFADVATREQFLADVAAPAESEPHAQATVAAKAASKKARIGGKKGK